MTEFTQYNVLKEAVRAKLTRQSSRPDFEKIKKDIRTGVEEEFRKKKNFPLSPPVRINISKFTASFAYGKDTIVCFHLVAFLLEDYFTPPWQKKIRWITFETVDAIFHTTPTPRPAVWGPFRDDVFSAKICVLFESG